MRNKRAICIIVVLLCGFIPLFAQNERTPPMQYGDIAYKQQESYAIVNGVKRHFWLYDTYACYDGDGNEVFRAALDWVSKMGYTVDFDNVEKYSPDTNMPNGVKEFIGQRFIIYIDFKL